FAAAGRLGDAPAPPVGIAACGEAGEGADRRTGGPTDRGSSGGWAGEGIENDQPPPLRSTVRRSVGPSFRRPPRDRPRADPPLARRVPPRRGPAPSGVREGRDR